MRVLTASEVLSVWEQGQQQDPTTQVLILLAAACPETSREELAGLSIGQRERMILEARTLLLSNVANGFAECPDCGAAIEYSIPTEALLGQTPHPDTAPANLETEGFSLRLRYLNSLDLLAVRHCGSLEDARRELAYRSVLELSRNGVPWCGELPESVLLSIARHLANADPDADLLLDMTCPVCDSHWQIAFDAAQFFWAEINSYAKRLLRQVHNLAHAYSWRESDILSMSEARRQFYLEMVG
jgi:uncharacterized protein (UPF0212 family)